METGSHLQMPFTVSVNRVPGCYRLLRSGSFVVLAERRRSLCLKKQNQAVPSPQTAGIIAGSRQKYYTLKKVRIRRGSE